MTGPTRSYDNTLRQQQSEQTRERILETLMHMASDANVKELSIAKLAKLSGVSQPTIYRHFPNRDALFEGFEDYLNRQNFVVAIPDHPEDWSGHITQLFEKFDENEEWVRASLREGWGADFRQQSRKRRLAKMQKQMDESLPQLSAKHRQWLFGLVQQLASADAWRSLKDNAGLDGAEAGEAVGWALDALLDAARRELAEAPATRDSKD
jgi:AcrR family transcriptional regulator